VEWVCPVRVAQEEEVRSNPLSFVEELATVPDPRSRKGRLHPLTAILSLTVVATLAGMKSLEAIAPFGRDHGRSLAHVLGFTRGKTPSKSCLSQLFHPLDVAALEEALGRWLLERVPHPGGDAIALDGKTARGSADGDVPGAHLQTAYVPTAAVLKQLRVAGRTNEHQSLWRCAASCRCVARCSSSKAAARRRLTAHPEEAVSPLYLNPAWKRPCGVGLGIACTGGRRV
jgi:hypothetical protein